MKPDYVYRVLEVVKIVDGDTVDLLIDLGFDIHVKQRIRLADIDTDELRGGTVETKARANAAKDRITELLNMGNITIQTQKDRKGKYGRLIGTLFVSLPENTNVVDVNKTLLNEGYQKGGEGLDFPKKPVFV